MKRTFKLYLLLAVAALSIVFANAQAGGSATQRFEKRGLAFDYPLGWTLTDGSADGVQTLSIAPENPGPQIVIRVERTIGRSCDFPAESRNITAALVEQVATQLHAVSPLRTSAVKTQVDKSDVVGTQLEGVVDGKRVTAEAYSARVNRQFVSLIFIRNDDDQLAQIAWEMVRRTMKLETAVVTYGAGLSEGSLNRLARVLPKPSYPPDARSAHVSGTVVVQVVIDETGNVISAHAVSGNSLLQGVSVDAARGAKFSPANYCGEPLRLTGVITYNFVAR